MREKALSCWVSARNAVRQEKAFVVMKISHVQSRWNAARRRRKVAARHGLAGHWGDRPAPMLSSGKVSYEVGANIDATCYGGDPAGVPAGGPPRLSPPNHPDLRPLGRRP